jgi:hypothetical protein
MKFCLRFPFFFDMETFAMKQSGMSFDDAKPMYEHVI